MEGGKSLFPNMMQILLLTNQNAYLQKALQDGIFFFFNCVTFFNELKDKVNSALREENQQL